MEPIICNFIDCPKVAMGHRSCLSHLDCFKGHDYNPIHCVHCVTFINEQLLATVSMDGFDSAKKDIRGWITKLRRITDRYNKKLILAGIVHRLRALVFQDSRFCGTINFCLKVGG